MGLLRTAVTLETPYPTARIAGEGEDGLAATVIAATITRGFALAELDGEGERFAVEKSGYRLRTDQKIRIVPHRSAQ